MIEEGVSPVGEEHARKTEAYLLPAVFWEQQVG